MGKFRKMGEGVYEMREVTRSRNVEVWNREIYYRSWVFWEPRQMSSLWLRVLGIKGLRNGIVI